MGVAGSHMLVSQTSARSSMNSAALSLTKPNRWFEPHSSSPSIIMVMGSGNSPVTAVNARHASMKVIMAFVVTGSARHDDLAAVGQRRDARRKWRRLPKVEWIDGLHVVMAVEEDARSLAVGVRTALAHHDRMAVGGPDAALKTNAGQILGHVLGSRLTLVLVGRVGRDRLDAQELEQPLEALIEIGVDFLQHGGKGMRGGHGFDALPCLLSGLSPPAERLPCAVRGGDQYRRKDQASRDPVIAGGRPWRQRRPQASPPQNASHGATHDGASDRAAHLAAD